MKNEQNKQQQVRVRYNETSALFASQFIINTSSEDLTINFSSGPITDPASGESVLPVHTRMAMTINGAHRLHTVLGNILKQQAEAAAAVPEHAQAQLPKIRQ
jgi:hypothetical protein